MINTNASVERRLNHLRDDGIRLQLFDALFDVAAAVWDQPGRADANESAAIEQAVLEYLLTPRIQDRIRRLEDLLVVLVSDRSLERHGTRARIAEVASRAVEGRMPVPRIGGESGTSSVVGVTRIGAGESSAVTTVVYDTMQLRSGGVWLRLPVGTIVRSGVEPVVLATIAQGSIAPEGSASRPQTVPRSRTAKAIDEPIEPPVEQHAET
jgi:hypothetical protein